MRSHPQCAVRLPMHVGGLTAQWTDEPNNASILGCPGIDLELVAAAPGTPDKEMHVGSLCGRTTKLTCTGRSSGCEVPETYMRTVSGATPGSRRPSFT